MANCRVNLPNFVAWCQENESLRREQDQSIQQIKDNYHQELSKARLDLDAKLKDSRGVDAAELTRVKSDLAERLTSIIVSIYNS